MNTSNLKYIFKMFVWSSRKEAKSYYRHVVGELGHYLAFEVAVALKVVRRAYILAAQIAGALRFHYSP